jgi:hypothetical protein
MPTVEQIAEKRTKDMDSLLSLNEKQYKKIYKMNLKEAKSEVSKMESGKRKTSGSEGNSGRPMGGPGMGGEMGHGGPGMGGGMGQGGGMPPMGGGMGQGGPGMGGQMGQGGGMPPQMSEESEEEMQKAKAKKKKKLKKILTVEQYQIWQKEEAKRESREFWKEQNDQAKGETATDSNTGNGN